MRSVSLIMASLALGAGCSESRPHGSGAGAPADAGVSSSDAGPGSDAGALCIDGPKKARPPARLHIINGTRAPTSVPLAPDQIMAVVAVGDESGGAFCTGTLISDRVVLTATHCTAGRSPSSMWVLFGEDDLDPLLEVPVVQKFEHRTHDITLLTVAVAPSTQIGVRPIPIFLGTLTRAHEGRLVEQAGYGDTQSSSHGRFFATELLESVDTWTFTVNGNGQQGVCYGDSGGPSLMVAPEGDVRVIGDLSEGDVECAQRDSFVRVDAVRAWIESVTGPTPPAGPEPCGSVSIEGTCRDGGAGATYCSNGSLVRETCTNGDVCGWSQVGWRCLERAVDPCGGLSHLGSCEGGVARWCEAGVPLGRDCGTCGESCLFLGDRIGFDCDPDPLECGELDFLGWCNGAVAEWCEEDRRERFDCATRGQVCRFIDAQAGFYCDDP